jgi:serine/threonine protein kinase/tetratricopeptide (TPR) repeat protein
MKLSAGFRLGPYEIVAPLGAGGMGEVYRGRDTRLGREVAIKIISGQVAHDPQSITRFEQEAKAVASLSHPNILAIHDFGTENDIVFAVMELLHGESLAERLARERLSWRTAVEIAMSVADGLASAHARGIIHRDLKPANIFVTTDGQVKILDFGLAKLQREPTPNDETTAGMKTERRPEPVVGTIGYMSPEQVTGASIDVRSDIFSLGCVLYEMIQGTRAFQGSSVGEVLAAILRDNPDDLTDSGGRYPAGIASVIRRCLQKNREERFQSARDLSFALKEIINAPNRGQSSPPRRIAFYVSAALAAVLIVAAVLWQAPIRRALGIGGSRVHSLAVLPLTNMSADRGQDYLADGVTEQLISDLAQLGDIRVTSRTSSMAYKDTKKLMPEIARELGVNAIVEGSVVRTGNRIKITAQLIDGSNDKHIWGETYERDLKDVLTIQREIARAVARSIHLELAPQALSRLDEERSIDPKSFEAFVRGRYLANKLGPENINAAIQEYQHALDSDPTNVLAYAGMAESYARLGYDNDLSPSDSFPKAKAAAQRALELDPNSADAHAVLGYIHMYYDWDFAAADADFRKAIALNPSLADAHHYYAVYLAAMLRPAEANREAAAARLIDPLSVPIASDAGFVMYYDRDYDKAIKTLKDAIAMNPKAAGPHFWLGRSYQAQRHYDQAIAEYKLGGPGISQWPPALGGLGHLYGLMGKRDEANKVLQQIEAASKNGYVTPYAAALVYLGLGNKDKTIELLQRCVAERTNWLVWLLKDPRWDPMRSDTRFQEIVKAVGFPEDARSRAPHATTSRASGVTPSSFGRSG